MNQSTYVSTAHFCLFECASTEQIVLAAAFASKEPLASQ